MAVAVAVGPWLSGGAQQRVQVGLAALHWVEQRDWIPRLAVAVEAESECSEVLVFGVALAVAEAA